MRTNAGRDLTAMVMGDTASSGSGDYASACWLALSANIDPPALTDDVLSGEITDGTLARAQGIYAHTLGSSSYTVSKTFTTDQAVTIAKVALFNAASDGKPVFESLLPSPIVFNASGDQAQITYAVVL